MKTEDNTVLHAQLGKFAEDARRATGARCVIIITDVRDKDSETEDDDREVYANIVSVSHEDERPSGDLKEATADLIASMIRGADNVIGQLTQRGLAVQVVDTDTGQPIPLPDSFGHMHVVTNAETMEVEEKTRYENMGEAS